ncbi:MAG TPA: hypothetical protein PLR71_03695 [Deltaproteobacteria bacterium]|nr:hypothetical protein [Deltaproteobacteria bacterium]
MELNDKTLLAALVAGLLCIAAVPEPFQDTPEALTADKPVRAEASADRGQPADSRMSRIDFGNTYIIGQTIKSGAVYLLQRKKSEIKSMLTYREDYRKEILEGFVTQDEQHQEGRDARGNPAREEDRTGKHPVLKGKGHGSE